MLTGKDSLQAKVALVEIQSKYQSLITKINNPVIAAGTGQYIAKLDTLTTSLKFLASNGLAGKVKDALAQTKALQGKFAQADEIKKFIRERKEQLKSQLENLGLTKQLKKFNKEAYYYSEQLKEYKELLHDSKKVERKTLELVSRTNLFKDFMRKNSMLASLFRMPGDPQNPLSQTVLAGLQTRTQVNNLIQQQLAVGGPNAQMQFRQNIQSAQNQIEQFKNKMRESGDGSSDDIMPEGFKPNTQKTRSFLNRIEIGTNVQTQRSTNYFPVTSDLGVSVGYRLSDHSSIGVGASYKLGWGQNIQHIKLTQQGAGLRSFVDWKLKGSLWLSGGYEMNYKTLFNSIDELRNLNAWQQSGLLGLSKVVSVKSKFFKKTKLQLLWDFLSYQQVPRTQPILFRINYNLK